MLEYEIHEMRGFWGNVYAYKVLTYADIPGTDHKILIGTREFEGKDAAEAYIEQQKQHDAEHGEHFTLF